MTAPGRARCARCRQALAGARQTLLATDGPERQVVLEVLGAPKRNEGLLALQIADEVTSYARLSHPNLVKVVDLFSSDGRLVIALEYVDGITLELLRDALDGVRVLHARDDGDLHGCLVPLCSTMRSIDSMARAIRSRPTMFAEWIVMLGGTKPRSATASSIQMRTS